MTSHRWHIIAVGLALAFVVVMASAGPLHSAPQQIPGLATAGSAPVQITNQPTVQAAQAGEWRVTVPGNVGVTLARGAVVSFEAPPFIEANHKYVIRWGAGLTGTYTVLEINHGWALVRAGSSRLWVNTALAVAIEDAK